MTAQTITANPIDSTISQRISTLRWLLPIPISVLPIVQQVVDQIRAVIDLIKANHLFEAESRLIALLPPTEMGKELYESNCAPCHESDGSGELGKKLQNNKFIQSMPGLFVKKVSRFCVESHFLRHILLLHPLLQFRILRLK